MMSIEVVLYVVGMFFLLISIHEWGHFVFAKRAGILVREFAIGFGPKLFRISVGKPPIRCGCFPLVGL